MTLAEFKAAVAAIPDTEEHMPIIETSDGSLAALRDVRIVDGEIVIRAGYVFVHRDGPKRTPGSVA